MNIQTTNNAENAAKGPYDPKQIKVRHLWSGLEEVADVLHAGTAEAGAKLDREDIEYFWHGS